LVKLLADENVPIEAVEALKSKDVDMMFRSAILCLYAAGNLYFGVYVSC